MDATKEARELVASTLCRCTGCQTIVGAIDDRAGHAVHAGPETLDEVAPAMT
jgi:aerobic-type carbon monoxide dehydrogenase small subunit (CoxS/CutS family)